MVWFKVFFPQSNEARGGGMGGLTWYFLSFFRQKAWIGSQLLTSLKKWCIIAEDALPKGIAFVWELPHKVGQLIGVLACAVSTLCPCNVPPKKENCMEPKWKRGGYWFYPIFGVKIILNAFNEFKKPRKIFRQENGKYHNI